MGLICKINSLNLNSVASYSTSSAAVRTGNSSGPGAALVMSGCAHYPVNAPLGKADARSGYRFESVVPQSSSDDLLLMLAFSGGGTRAAALSYGVLEQLRRTDVGA